MINNIPGLKFLISVITPEPDIKVYCLSRFKNEIFEFMRCREYLTTIITGAFLLISGLLPLSSGTAATNTPVTDSEGNPSAMTIPGLTPARIQPYLDAVLPVPGKDNQFWVFSGEYYRKVEVDKDEFYIELALSQVYLTSPGDSPGEQLRFVKELTKEPNQKWRLFSKSDGIM